MKNWETVNGKGITYDRIGNHYVVRFIGGGAVPTSLTGVFTSEREVEIAIIAFIHKNAPQHKQGSAAKIVKDALDGNSK